MNHIAEKVIGAKKTPWGILCEMSDGTIYHAMSDDPNQDGRDTYELLVAGMICKVEEISDEDAAMYRAQENMSIVQELTSEAGVIIRNLSDERDAGIISDDDLERWKAWVAYRKALREIDATAPDIQWPDKPQ